MPESCWGTSLMLPSEIKHRQLKDELEKEKNEKLWNHFQNKICPPRGTESNPIPCQMCFLVVQTPIRESSGCWGCIGRQRQGFLICQGLSKRVLVGSHIHTLRPLLKLAQDPVGTTPSPQHSPTSLTFPPWPVLSSGPDKMLSAAL